MTIVLPSTRNGRFLMPPRGQRGLDGLSPGSPVTFDASTTDADPGNGELRLNNAAAASATLAYIDNLDRNGVSTAEWLDSFNDHGSVAARGLLKISERYDGTNVIEYVVTGSVVDATTYRKVTIAYLRGAATFTAGMQLQIEFTPFGAPGTNGSSGFSPGHLFGLETARNSVNDDALDIGVGSARDATNAEDMVLATPLTKLLTSTWAVGSGNGGLDTGTLASNTTYHVFLIKRSDTGVVDVLFSTDPTTPVMPANYDYARRIWSIKYGTDAIRAYRQVGNRCWLTTHSRDKGTTTLITTAAVQTLFVPAGIRVRPILRFSQRQNASAGIIVTAVGNGDDGTTGPIIMQTRAASEHATALVDFLYTNTLQQIYLLVDDLSGTPALDDFNLDTLGWIDDA